MSSDFAKRCWVGVFAVLMGQAAAEAADVTIAKIKVDPSRIYNFQPGSIIPLYAVVTPHRITAAGTRVHCVVHMRPCKDSGPLYIWSRSTSVTLPAPIQVPPWAKKVEFDFTFAKFWPGERSIDLWIGATPQPVPLANHTGATLEIREPQKKN